LISSSFFERANIFCFMKNLILYFFAVLILIFTIFILFANYILPVSYEEDYFKTERKTASILPLDQREEEKDIIVIAVGDIMLNRGVEYMVQKEGDGDFKFPFLKIADYLNKADILFGNLEGPISERGVKIGSIYSFRMSPSILDGLNYAGFNVLSLANNHMFDYSRIALEDTMIYLEENGIIYAGAGFNEEKAFSLKIKEVKGIKIGFLAYTNLGPKSWKAHDNNSGMAWINWDDISRISDQINKAKRETDVLFVSLHAGDEYSLNPSAFQKEFARASIDAGADVFLGHHPHVVQEVERYKDGWIAYSLGNFIFDQSFSEETMEGLLLEIVITNGRIEKVVEKKTKISDYFWVELQD
jgi:poly-gamma-glutamate capsule biosynthesis protein CapA/YwtB (metallophosphatase superfamily)